MQSQMRCLKTDSHFSIAYKILLHLKSFGINKCRKTEKQTISGACLYIHCVTPDLYNCRKQVYRLSTVLKRDTGQKYKKVKL